VNVWTFSGRVGADAELRTTQSGEKVLSFRVCNTIGFGDRKTEQWVDCSYWGKRAEAVSSYVRKGDKITVSGELKLEDFQRRDGTPGSKLAVRVNDLDLAARNDGASTGGYVPDHQAPLTRNDAGPRSSGEKPAFDMDLDDSVPF
jgi:single-strand DNA-binding protein